MAGRVQFVINPAAGNKKAAKIWPPLHACSQRILGDVAAEFTSGVADATRIARRALRDGYEIIVAVGGDGTINEVVNGFFDNGAAVNSEASLAVVSAGTGADWLRTWKMPRDPESIALCLSERKTRKCDLGLLTSRGLDGGESSRLFINIADVGFGGAMAHRSHQSPRVLGAFLTYLTDLLSTLVAYQNKRMTVTVDEAVPEKRTVNSLVVANGQFFGGGMWVAPEASTEDGRFEIVIIGDVTRREVLANLPRLYRGTIARHRKVTAWQGERVTVDSDDPAVFIEADGELAGRLPASFRIMPSCLNVVTA